ncbi:hypothetical protein OG900_04995 [Streptomyces sp. NBC_00433]
MDTDPVPDVDSAGPAEISTSTTAAPAKGLEGPVTPGRPFLPPGKWYARSALTCLFVVGLLFRALKGDRSLAELWALAFPVFLVGCAVVRGTWRATATWWLLHRHGVTTVATYAGYEPGEDGNSPGTRIYHFTALSGTTHEIRRSGFESGPFEAGISYDPARPDLARGPAQPWARTLILLAHLLTGVPVTLLTVAYLLWYFTTAPRA